MTILLGLVTLHLSTLRVEVTARMKKVTKVIFTMKNQKMMKKIMNMVMIIPMSMPM